MAAFATGSAIVVIAEQFIGKIPYKLNASSTVLNNVAQGIVADCSSFVQSVYAGFGIQLPRNAAAQYKQTQGQTVATTPDTSKLQPGDLLFFGGYNTPENKPGYGGVQHVAIYAGNGMVVDEGGANPLNVGTTTLSSYGASHFIAATRPTGIVGPGLDLNPLDAPSAIAGNINDAINGATSGIAGAISGIGSTFNDIAVFLGVVGLAFVLIIGGIILIRPQTVGEVAGAASGAVKG